MKTIVIFFLIIFIGCEISDEIEDTETKKGACVHTYYYNGSYDQHNKCYNDFKENTCEGIYNSFGYEYEWSSWHKGSTCQDEGYTKGCGGSFTAENEGC